MAGKTNTEKIEDLARLVHILVDRVDSLRTEVSELNTLSSRVAVLEHQVADLKKSLDTLHVRLWQIGIPLVVGVIVTLLTALLRK